MPPHQFELFQPTIFSLNRCVAPSLMVGFVADPVASHAVGTWFKCYQQLHEFLLLLR